MNRLCKTLALASLAAAALGGAGACLDLTPIVYETASKPDAHVEPTEAGEADAQGSDGASTDAPAPDVDMRPPCVRCITAPDDAAPPGCGEEIAACVANTECAATYACALANGCFEQPSFRDIVNCGLPCAENAGITSTMDPAVTLIENIAVCAQANCSEPCHIGDAGLGGD